MRGNFLFSLDIIVDLNKYDIMKVLNMGVSKLLAFFILSTCLHPII